MPNVILDHILFPPKYGGIGKIDNATETTIAEAGTDVQVTIFDTNSPSNGITPDHTNDHITVANSGDYLFILKATIESSAGLSSVMDLSIKKNNGDALIGDLHVHRAMGGGTGDIGAVPISGSATLVAGDTVEVWIANETNTQNYTVEDINLYIEQKST